MKKGRPAETVSERHC